MKNPWLKMNPFMSMWLTGANKVMGSARGQATAAVKREATKAVAAATAAAVKQLTEVRTPTPAKKPPSAARKRRTLR